MDRDEAATAFLARIHSLVTDYIGGTAPAGPLRSAVRRVWAQERMRRAGTELDPGSIREVAARESTDIDLSWPGDKPPDIRMLQGALKEVVALCDEPGTGRKAS